MRVTRNTLFALQNLDLGGLISLFSVNIVLYSGLAFFIQ